MYICMFLCSLYSDKIIECRVYCTMYIVSTVKHCSGTDLLLQSTVKLPGTLHYLKGRYCSSSSKLCICYSALHCQLQCITVNYTAHSQSTKVHYCIALSCSLEQILGRALTLMRLLTAQRNGNDHHLYKMTRSWASFYTHFLLQILKQYLSNFCQLPSLWLLWKHFKFPRQHRFGQICEFNLVSHFVANISSSIYLGWKNLAKYISFKIFCGSWWEIFWGNLWCGKLTAGTSEAIFDKKQKVSWIKVLDCDHIITGTNMHRCAMSLKFVLVMITTNS